MNPKNDVISTELEAPLRRQTFAAWWAGDLGYRHAGVAVAGAVAAGWGIELARGGGAIVPPAWPVNIILLGAFLLWLWMLARMGGRMVAWLASVPFALVSMLAVGLLAAIGGIVPQESAENPAWVQAAGLDHVFTGAPFAVAMLLLLSNLGLATLRKVRALGPRAWFFSLNHAGLWIALACGFFGAGDVIRARMVIVEGQAEAMVVDARGRHGYLPFGLFLERFYIKRYGVESGAPGAVREYVAETTVLGADKRIENVIIEVNKPLRRNGWALYLTSYELSPTGLTDQCVIEAVRDPWLPAVYTGIFLLLGGSVAMLFRSPFDSLTPLPGAQPRQPSQPLTRP